MKNKITTAKFYFFIFVIVCGLLGVRVGSTLYQYEVVVNGTLGFFVLYLVFRVYWSTTNDGFRDNHFVFSENIRYFAFAFVYSIVVYWALIQLIDLFSFLIKLVL